MNDRITEQFLNDNSYIWLVAKSMVGYMGFKDMTEFLNDNYYIKVNMSRGTVEEFAGARLDFAAYPKDYAEFIRRFTEEVFPGGDTEQLRRDLDRNNLLSRMSGRAWFVSKEYALHDEEHNTLKLCLFGQLYTSGEEIFASMLAVDLTTLYRKNSRSKEHSEFDTLTGTFNRAYGERVGTERLEYHPDESAVVISADVAGFTAINAEHGQRGGNLVLVDAAVRLSSLLGTGRIITRTGPDEFICMMPGTTAEQAVEALRSLTADAFVVRDGEREIAYRLNAGYAVYPSDSRDYTQLCRMAEVAAGHSKLDSSAPFFHYERPMLREEHGSSGFNMTDIVNNIPGAILVYRADAEGEIIYANSETVRLFDCGNFDEFMAHTGGHWKGFVYHEDYERVESEIWGQQNAAGNETSTDYLRFRILTKNGVLRTVDDIGRLVDSPYYGKVFYVFLNDVNQKDDILQRAMR